MLGISDTAAEAIRGFLEDAPEGSGLRIDAAPDSSPDAEEAEIEMSIAEQPEAGDQVVEENGVRVFVSPSLSEALNDLTLDAEEHGDHYHFGFMDQDGAAEGNSTAP